MKYLWNLSRSSILLFLPYFLVELFGFLEFFLSFIVKMCCSIVGTESMKKVVSKCDLLFFVGKKDKTGKEKILCLESAKLFFGYGPQLCFQLWILQATPVPSFSQYLSIISSCVLSTKSAFVLITYSRAAPVTTEQKRTWSEKFLCLLRMILEFLTWLPLILTSVLFKIGSINLYMKFFGWYSAAMIFSIICLNTAGIVCLSHLSLSKQRFSIWTENLPSTDETNHFHWSEGLFISFTNMFVISRPFNTIRKIFTNIFFLIGHSQV